MANTFQNSGYGSLRSGAMVAANSVAASLQRQSVLVASAGSSCEQSKDMAASECGIQGVHVTNRSCWYTGAVTRMCLCGGPQIPVATDGRKEWAHCPMCGKTWDMNTLKEIHALDSRTTG